MPTVTFAAQLQRHVRCPPQQVAADTLGAALQMAFTVAPALRSYVLDDQGHVRKHVAVFVNNEMIGNRRNLNLPLQADDSVMVIQALSGG